MRTTISLDEALLKQARQVALDRGISLNELVVTALRLELYRSAQAPRKKMANEARTLAGWLVFSTPDAFSLAAQRS
jgi:hypothetical protein